LQSTYWTRPGAQHRPDTWNSPGPMQLIRSYLCCIVVLVWAHRGNGFAMVGRRVDRVPLNLSALNYRDESLRPQQWSHR
jgi:hypothetical protein